MENDYDWIFKVVLVGDSGVGKSCESNLETSVHRSHAHETRLILGFLLRYADNTYTEEFISTIGVDFKIRTIDVDGEIVKVQVWDTCGQDRFRYPSRTPSYRNAHGIIIMYDITDMASFDNVKQWLAEINRYACSTVNKLLIGTKIDLPQNRIVPFATAQLFADEVGIKLIETSAKTSENVQEAMIWLVLRILKRRRQEVLEVKKKKALEAIKPRGKKQPSMFSRAVGFVRSSLPTIRFSFSDDNDDDDENDRDTNGKRRASQSKASVDDPKLRQQYIELRRAAVHGLKADIDRLLAAKQVDPSTDNSCAIRLAAEKGHLTIVERLLKDGRADPSADKNCSIRVAAEYGRIAVVERLLQDKRVDPSAENNYAVRWAVMNGHWSVVDCLLRDGRVDPSTMDNEAIISASAAGRSNIVERLLQDKRVDPAVRAGDALRFAAQRGYSAVVHLLLKDGRVDPAAANSDALRRASANGHTVVVGLLLFDKRAQPSASGNEAIFSAAVGGYAEIVHQLLVDKRADPSECAENAISKAAANGHAAVVDLLLRDGRVDPTVADNEAIRSAASRGHIDVVECLLRDGRACVTHAIQIFTDDNRHDLLKRLECRERMTEICVSMHGLSLAAWITVLILDAACPWSELRLGIKWDLVCTVKHFHDRQNLNAKDQCDITMNFV